MNPLSQSVTTVPDYSIASNKRAQQSATAHTQSAGTAGTKGAIGKLLLFAGALIPKVSAQAGLNSQGLRAAAEGSLFNGVFADGSDPVVKQYSFPASFGSVEQLVPIEGKVGLLNQTALNLFDPNVDNDQPMATHFLAGPAGLVAYDSGRMATYDDGSERVHLYHFAGDAADVAGQTLEHDASFNPPGTYTRELILNNEQLWTVGLRINAFDISDPSSHIDPLVTDLTNGNMLGFTGGAIKGEVLWVTDVNDLLSYDISQAKEAVEPTQLSDTTVCNFCIANPLRLEGNTAFVADVWDFYLLNPNRGEMNAIDIADPSSPIEFQDVRLPTNVQDYQVDGNILYAALTDGSLDIWDYSDRAEPVQLMNVKSDAFSVNRVSVDANNLYLVDDLKGMQVVDKQQIRSSLNVAAAPTASPVTSAPTATITSTPTRAVTDQPTDSSTTSPTASPEKSPTTTAPTNSLPTDPESTRHPTQSPSQSPSKVPSKAPSQAPATGTPTGGETARPATSSPITSAPSTAPVQSQAGTEAPTNLDKLNPTAAPTPQLSSDQGSSAPSVSTQPSPSPTMLRGGSNGPSGGGTHIGLIVGIAAAAVAALGAAGTTIYCMMRGDRGEAAGNSVTNNPANAAGNNTGNTAQNEEL